MASKRRERALAAAASGSSNAPGTSTTVTSRARAPISRSASCAPARRPSTTAALKVERSSSTRRPRASARAGEGDFIGADSLALEPGGPLLEEGLRPLLHVLGRADEAEQRRLLVLRLVQAHLQAVVDRVEREAQRQRPVGQHLAQQRVRL